MLLHRRRRHPDLSQLCEGLARLHSVELILVAQQHHAEAKAQCRRDARHARICSPDAREDSSTARSVPARATRRLRRLLTMSRPPAIPAWRVRHRYRAFASDPVFPPERPRRPCRQRGSPPIVLYCVTLQTMADCFGRHTRSREHAPLSEAIQSRDRCCRHLPLRERSRGDVAGDTGVDVVVVGRRCRGPLGGCNLLERHRKAVPQGSTENRPDSPHRGDRHGLVPHEGRIGSPHVEGKKIFRDLTHQMFNGTDRAVRLYGTRPPLQSPALITNAHKYQFQEDGSAMHLFNEDDRVVDLHVCRADVKRWVRDSLAERRKAAQQRKSRG